MPGFGDRDSPLSRSPRGGALRVPVPELRAGTVLLRSASLVLLGSASEWGFGYGPSQHRHRSLLLVKQDMRGDREHSTVFRKVFYGSHLAWHGVAWPKHY